MAYPNQIKTTGALSQSNDVLEYFVSALLDNRGDNPENWGTWIHPDPLFAKNYFIDGGINGITFPATREKFYSHIDVWTITTNSSDSIVDFGSFYFRTIHGTKLYQVDEPLGNINWPVEAVNHWGKIKTLELALFGNIANGGGLTDTSIVGSGVFSDIAPNMKTSSNTYLRYALSRFDSYGPCHPDYVEGPTLVYVNEDISFRRIFFNKPSGVLVGDIEVSDNGGVTFGPMLGASTIGDQVSWPIPSGDYEPYDIVIRVRASRGAYIEEGPEIYNQLTYT